MIFMYKALNKFGSLSLHGIKETERMKDNIKIEFL